MERRTIEELLVRYELEPSLRDVFVEGEYDKYLIAWFLRENGLSQVAVYPISSVEIVDGDVLAAGLDANNKGRTIELARVLSQRMGDTNLQFTCVVDQDFDLVLKKEHPISCLLATDYTCMEMYLFNEKVIDKFSSLVVKGFPYSSGKVLEMLAGPLQELFLIRLTNHVLRLGLKAIPFGRCCVFEAHEICFDAEEFLKRYLNKNDKHSETERFESTVAQYRVNLPADCRCQMNGHDFVEMLTWLIKTATGVTIDPEMICGSLTACVESEMLIREHLFASLKKRLGA